MWCQTEELQVSNTDLGEAPHNKGEVMEKTGNSMKPIKL